MGQVTQALQQLEVALALAQKSQDKVWTATVLRQSRPLPISPVTNLTRRSHPIAGAGNRSV